MYYILLLIFSLGSLSAGLHRDIKKKNISSLERRGIKKQNSALLRAIEATKKLPDNVTSRKKFLKTAYYIESHQPYLVRSTKNYFPKKKTKAAHDIEYDPATKNTFVVLRNKKSFLGSGVKKRVYKAIHYNRASKLLARSEQTIKMDLEFKAHKSLQGARGIMNAHAFTTYKHKKKKHYTIYSDLYEGTLHDLFSKGKLTFRNKVIIMSDLLHGLESLHNKGFAHRDLHSYNYLVHAENGPGGEKLWRAVIADLGRTVKLGKLKGDVAQMTRRMYAPEAFKHKKLRGKDYQATDIYALGCIFHRLLHNKYPSWQGGFVKSKRLSVKKKRKKLTKKLEKATVKRRKSLERSAATSKERLELIILKMLNVNPKKRGTAASLQNELQGILRTS